MSEEMTFEELLNRDGHLAFTNKGVSMMPLLRQGKDVMLIRKKGPERCKRLDAVLFRRPRRRKEQDAYVLHRILRINPDGSYWIVGDNCVTGDTVREEQVIGILTGVVRGKRTIRVTDPGYRLYVNTWCRWYRVRIFLLKARNFIKRGAKRTLRRFSGQGKAAR